MQSKHQTLTALKDELQHWETLLASLPEEQIIAPLLPVHESLRDLVEHNPAPKSHPPYNLSVKDIVAHLHTWQKGSLACAEAALHHHAPRYPAFPPGLNPDNEDDIDRINAWIYETHREQPWSTVYQNWHETYRRLLEYGEAISEEDWHPVGKFPWLPHYPLSRVFEASYEHHHDDHLVPLLAWREETKTTP